VSATYFAVFPDSIRCHPTVEDRSATLCGIPTKGGSADSLMRYPPARLKRARPAGYVLCPRCEDAQGADKKGQRK